MFATTSTDAVAALMVRTVVLSVPAPDADIAGDRLWAAGARAVEERSEPDGSIELHSVLAADDVVSRERLGELPTAWKLRFVDVDDTPQELWRHHARPIEIGDRLVIRPAWLASRAPTGVLDVAIEPAGSFGLGDHPTTRLCAGVVDRTIRPGDRVLDVGCGSGVLAVIAALRGANSVTAIDISEAAVEASLANVELNAVADRVDVSSAGLETVPGPFDLVVANILAPTLLAMAARLRDLTAPSGTLVISGVLAGSQHHHVLDALRPMCVAATEELDGWAAVQLTH